MAFNLGDYNPSKVIRNAEQQGKAGGALLQAIPDALRELKSALDAGKIGVADYLEAGKKLAHSADASYQALAPLGARAASEANAVRVYDQLRELGFDTDNSKAPGSADRFNVDLGQKYEKQLREEMLPKDLSPEEKQRFLDQIPTDIGFDTDRYKIEREGIRQQIQNEKGLTEQKNIQADRRNQLSDYLAKQTERQFGLDVPAITSESQNAGQFETSGYGEALARRRAELAGRAQDIIAGQAISDRDFEVNSIANTLSQRQNFQTAGLERTFSTEDRANQFQQALLLAQLAKPQGPSTGKTNGEKWAQGIQVASTAAGAGAKFIHP